MPNTWVNVLKQYKYPVKLSDYDYSNKHQNFFDLEIMGDRKSTIQFEKRFRENSDKIDAWCEVIFWKLYSQGGRAEINTKLCWDYWRDKDITGKDLRTAAEIFIKKQDKSSLKEYKYLWPFTSGAITILITHISFLKPEEFPMADSRIAKWVNQQYISNIFNRCVPCEHQLIKPNCKISGINLSDFEFYIHWISWTRYMATKLTEETDIKWRARDVEMAVFTAQGNNPPLELNPL